MSVFQPNPTHSLTRGAAAARQINAGRQVAQHVLDTTFKYESDKEIVCLQMGEPAYFGTLTFEENELIYLVASKFEHRYYIVQVCKEGGYRCSSRDTVVRHRCIEKAKQYIAQQEAARVAAVAAREEKKAEAKMHAFNRSMEEQYSSDPREAA